MQTSQIWWGREGGLCVSVCVVFSKIKCRLHRYGGGGGGGEGGLCVSVCVVFSKIKCRLHRYGGGGEGGLCVSVCVVFSKIKCRLHGWVYCTSSLLFPGISMRWQSSMTPQWCDLVLFLVLFLMAPPTSHAQCHQVASCSLLHRPMFTGSNAVSLFPVTFLCTATCHHISWLELSYNVPMLLGG